MLETTDLTKTNYQLKTLSRKIIHLTLKLKLTVQM